VEESRDARVHGQRHEIPGGSALIDELARGIGRQGVGDAVTII